MGREGLSLQQAVDTTATALDAAAAGSNAPRKKYLWTTTEIAALRRVCAQRCSWDEAKAALPGRSEVAVYQKATELGLQPTWVRERRAANEELDEEIRRRLGADNAAAGEVTAIAAQFQMPAWYVSRRASQLGVGRSRLKEPEWNSAELEILETYGEDGPAVVHRQLRLAGSQRTLGSVCMALKRRNIEKLARSSMSARATAELMGVDGKTVVRWIEHCGLKARPTGGTWSIDRREFRKWLLNHPDSFDLRKVRQVWFMDLMKG